LIFWRGYGILVAVFTIVCYICVRIIAENVWGEPLPIDKRKFAELAGMLLAAAAAYGLHRLLLRLYPPKTVIDKETGLEIKLVSNHDLFFIPVKHWPYVLVALGLLFAFQ